MKKCMVLQWMLSVCVWFSVIASAGDLTCYGYTSTTDHFFCTSVGNCTWWAAAKRPDLASVIDASNSGGWNGGQWYDKFRDKGFSVGSVPKPGSVVEFSRPGHVAFVERVNSDGSFEVTEMDSTGWFNDGINYATYYPDGNNTYHRNNGPVSAWTLKGFIYPRGISSESDTVCDLAKERCDLARVGSIGWFPAVSNCRNATQWFIMGIDPEGTPYPIGSRPDSSACPTDACSINN